MSLVGSLAGCIGSPLKAVWKSASVVNIHIHVEHEPNAGHVYEQEQRFGLTIV